MSFYSQTTLYDPKPLLLSLFLFRPVNILIEFLSRLSEKLSVEFSEPQFMKPFTFISLTISIFGQLLMAFIFAEYASNNQLKLFPRLGYSLLAFIFLSITAILVWLMIPNVSKVFF